MASQTRPVEHSKLNVTLTFHINVNKGTARSVNAPQHFDKPSEVNTSFWFPYEVIELILLQVTAILFKGNQDRLLPCPDVIALAAVGSVSRDWFEVITGRRTIRRKLKFTFRKLTVLPVELFKAKMAVLLRHRLLDQTWLSSRDADVNVLQTVACVCRHWMVSISDSGDLKRITERFHYNPQLLVILDDPPRNIEGSLCGVLGVVMLENYVYVVYEDHNKVEVFDFKDCYKKVKDIEVEGLKEPVDMTGSDMTSQLFIKDFSGVIKRVDLKTGVSDMVVKLDNVFSGLSLLENRLLMTSNDSLLVYDIHSGEIIQNIPLAEDIKKHVYVWHAVETGRDAFFVSHGQQGSYTVSEIDTEGRVIRVFHNEEQLGSGYFALDSVGRLLVVDFANESLVSFGEQLEFKRILLDSERLDGTGPMRVSYNKNNNRLAVGLDNGKVMIFECSV